jgi:hypothetical protein
MRRRLAALAALALVAGCGQGGAQSDHGDRGLTLSPGDSSVDRARERFSSLRGNGESPSTLGNRGRDQAASITSGKPFSVHPVVRRPGYDFYVLETSDELCTYEVRESAGTLGGCGAPEAFARGGLSYTIGGRVTAFLPDGSSDVTLTHADGSTSQLHVRNNHATKVFDQLPERASWTRPDGTVESTRLEGPPEDAPSVEAQREP